MPKTTLQQEHTSVALTLYLAFELSGNQWKLAFSTGGLRVREVAVAAADIVALAAAIEAARRRFALEADARVVSCYEAGRDGFWLHRWLDEHGVANLVVDSSSIEVNRRARRAKTDRLDVRKLLAMLVRYDRGERDLWSVLRVPTLEQEDARRLHRELGRLKHEMTAHRNRIRSLLVLHGINSVVFGAQFASVVASTLRPDGTPLPSQITAELVREHERLELAQRQIRELNRERKERLEEAAEEPRATGEQEKKVAELMQLRALGVNTSWLLVHEVFGWRHFRNRRELAGAIGLTPTPFQSGGESRDQGISKAGNPRVRTAMIELAWLWLRYQPDSQLSCWYRERFGGGQGRMRRVGIVALARRLLIAIWRYVQGGVVPEGAVLKAA